MLYLGARYQKIAGELCEDCEVIYVCNGKIKSEGKSCRGKVAFQLENNGGSLIECQDRLIKHRAHSEWCEFFKCNTELNRVATRYGSSDLKRGRQKKRKEKKFTQPAEEPADQRSDSRMSPVSSSNIPVEPAASSSASEKSEEEEPNNSVWDLCGKCKMAYDGKTPMIQCDLCFHWFHYGGDYVCEQVTDEEAEHEKWYCSTCRSVLAESEKAQASQPNDADKSMRTFLDKSLNTLNDFFDYLINEAEPIKEKRFRVRLKLCKLKIEKVLNKYNEEDRENGRERWKETNDALMKSFQSIEAKVDGLNSIFEELASGHTGQNSARDDNSLNCLPDLNSADSSIEQIGLGSFYGLTFEEEYERINTSLRSSATKNVPTITHRANHIASTTQPSDGESTSDKTATITSEPLDHPNGSSQPNAPAARINQKPLESKVGLTNCSSSQSESSQSNSIDRKLVNLPNIFSSTSQQGESPSSQPISRDPADSPSCSQPTKKLKKSNPFCIVID